MEQNNRALTLYPLEETLSNPRMFRAVVDWPEGLSGTPIVYPLGNTAEQADQIREALEQALTKKLQVRMLG